MNLTGTGTREHGTAEGPSPGIFRVRVIRKDRQNIGYLTINKADVITLQSLYIVSEYQRQGIGRQAFDFMSAYCREHHATAFICHCVPENFNARSFYERMGGEVIGEDADKRGVLAELCHLPVYTTIKSNITKLLTES